MRALAPGGQVAVDRSSLERAPGQLQGQVGFHHPDQWRDGTGRQLPFELSQPFQYRLAQYPGLITPGLGLQGGKPPGAKLPAPGFEGRHRETASCPPGTSHSLAANCSNRR